MNLTTSYKPNVYTRTSSAIFFQNPSKVKRIYIKTSNLTGYSEFSNFRNKVATSLSKKYEIVEIEDLADVIFDLKIVQFSEVSGKVIANIERYWQYNDTSEQTTIKEVGKTGFTISDDNVSIGDAQNGNLGTREASQSGVLVKMAQNDLISGLAIGGISGFYISGSNPIGAFIGGMIGGGISLTMQKYTQEKAYMATMEIDVAQKMPKGIVYEEKYLHKQDDNGMHWYNTQYQENALHKRVKMFGVVKQSVLNQSDAAGILSEKLAISFADGV